jgi:heme A synthase
MPESLHAELAQAADVEGVSLNQFITNALATVIEDGRAERTPARTRRARWFTVLLALNLLIVAGAGVVAILLLVSTWGS